MRFYWRKNLQNITQEPFKSVLTREWFRAKRILPILKRKPKFIWASPNYLGGGVQGRCRRSENKIFLHNGYLKHALFKEFVDTVRHEIAHIPKPSNRKPHGKDFMWWLQKLGGSRYCVMSIRELAKKKKDLPPKKS